MSPRPPFDWLAPDAPCLRSSLRLVGKAVAAGWDVPEADRPALAEALWRLVQQGTRRQALGAVRVLILMDAQNVR